MRATATVLALDVRDSGYAAPVDVMVHDAVGVAIFEATIGIWIPPRART